ncbi:hypothetical protein [Amycolatopsis nigrescens]|uniref:hypothetical protein n=1 Tax=Amycolatopsis nigrescens TaxID=381445 RepID=UPI00037F0285|nr:hypothetical protein [Amycolatopsis nigrescens]
MGKHHRRRASHLPKVAAGAAPFALLLAGPATGWAATAPAPSGDQHESSYLSDFDSGHATAGHAGATDYVSFIKGYVAAMNHDVSTADFDGGQAVADTSQSLDGALDAADQTTVGTDGSTDSNSFAQGLIAGTEAQRETVQYGDFTAMHDAAESGEAVFEAAREFQSTPQGAVRAAQSLTGASTADRASSELLGHGDHSVLTSNAQHLEQAAARDESAAFDPVSGTLDLTSEESGQAAGSDASHHLVQLGRDFTTVTSAAEQAEGGLTRTAGFTGDENGNAQGYAGMDGDGTFTRTAAQAVQAGDSTGVIGSDQAGKGAFTGTLESVRDENGTVTTAAAGAADGVFAQENRASGKLGPLSAAGISQQVAKGEVAGTGESTVNPADGKTSGSAEGVAEGSAADHTGGEIGVDGVLKLSGSAKTEASGSTSFEQNNSYGWPEEPVTRHSGSFSHQNEASVELLGGQPVGGGLEISAPPLAVTPGLTY